jgi:tetratricopeptide (TPR) repeat protein
MIHSPLTYRVLAVLLSFAAALAAFVLLRGPEPPAAAAPAAGAAARAPEDAGAEIARLQSAARAAPRDVAPRVALASAYLRKARESGDPGFYARAGELLRAALARRPGDHDALVASAGLALSRHDFRGALALARRARAARPDALAAYPALVDALVELGRFGTAERLLQRMVDAKPTLAGYARVSYLRELHGDVDGAAAAMRRAVAAGGPARESVAAVQALLGGLELARGRPAAARAAHRAALAAVPGYPAAEAGLARLDAARGDLDGAIRRWRALSARLPLPEYVLGLAEAELAAGRTRAGRRDLALIRAERRLLAGAGVDTDAELALYEADHGSPRRAVALAWRAWRAAPGLRSADALGWALTRGGRPAAGLRWARRALRLGSVDPLFRHHAGIAALGAGDESEGRRQLRTALAHGLGGWPWHAAAARRILRGGAR